MKILYVAHSFPPFHWRGTEVYAMELASAVSRSAETEIFYLRDDRKADFAALESVEFDGLKVNRVRDKVDPADPETYFFNPPQEEKFREVMARFKPDVVHFLYFTGGLSLTLPAAAGELGAKTFITVTDFSGFCPRGQSLDGQGNKCPGPREAIRCVPCLFDSTAFVKWPWLDKILRERFPTRLVPARPGPRLKLLRRRLEAARDAFKGADAVIYPNGNALARYHLAGMKGGNEKVMDYGVDLSRFSGHVKSKSERPRLAFIGQLLPHKGLELLAHAAKDVPLKHRLLVYGSLDDPGAREYYQSLPLPDYVEYKGTFPFKDMNLVLEEIDVLVVPSTWDENCPLIVKYGIATGTYLALADQPGMVFAKEALERAFFFAPGSASDLRRALIRAIAQLKEDRKTGAGSPSEVLARAREKGAVIDVADQAYRLLKLYGETK